MANKITLLCASDRMFLKHSAAMIASAKDCTPDAKFHILFAPAADALPYLGNFVSSIQPYITTITFVMPQEIVVPNARAAREGRISAAAYSRLVLPLFAPPDVDRALYLDGDCIVRSSLQELADMDLKGKPLAGVENPGFNRWDDIGVSRDPGFFNSGVLVVDLDYWRSHNMTDRCFELLHALEGKRVGAEQDILNAAFSGNWLPLPYVWNCQVDKIRFKRGPIPTFAESKVIHYCGMQKPWQFPREASEWDAPYDKYAKMVSYPTARIMGYPLEDNVKRYKRILSRVTSGKKARTKES